MIQLQQFFTKVPLAAVGQIRRKREGGQVGRPVGQGDPAGTGPRSCHEVSRPVWLTTVVKCPRDTLWR